MQVRGTIVALIVSALFFSEEVLAAPYGRTLCKYAGFDCVRVRSNQSWHSLFPDDRERDLVMRINRMNTSLYPGLVIAVPKDLENADVIDFSPFPTHINAPGEKVVVIDPAFYAWGAYDQDGTLVRWGPASSGADYCSDIDEACKTHPGSFRVFSMGSSGCISHKFPLPDGGAPMPYCMYFNNGQALHGEPNGLPGYNASHGCVRLYVSDAEWLRYDFIEGPNESNAFRGTRIIVKKGEQSADKSAEHFAQQSDEEQSAEESDQS
jgi:L,D-transpeptidase ErfK/SrfK